MATMAVACRNGPDVVKLYEDKSATHTGFTRPFVVAVTSEADQRVFLESGVLAKLHQRGVTGVASHPLIESSEEMLQEDIDRAIAESGADSLLITHIAGVETELREEKGREEIVSTCRGGNPVDMFLYDHRVIKVPDSLRLAVSVVIITSLHDATTGSRLWTIQSTCFHKDNIAEALLESSDAIVRQLEFDGLIRPAPGEPGRAPEPAL